MGITVRQPGAAKAAAGAGAIVGKAQKEKEDRARKEREQVRADAAAAQRDARKTAMKWETQKMQINSQRAFERELRQEDYRLAAEDRSAAWQIEKMEMASRMDFEREEGERQRKLGAIDTERTAWEKEEKEGRVDKGELEYRNAMSGLNARELAIKTGQPYRPVDHVAAQQAANRETRAQEVHEKRMVAKEDPFADVLKQLLPESPNITGATSPPTNPMPTMYQEAINDKTGEKIISRDGGKTWEPVEPERVIPPANFGAFNRDRDPSALIRQAPFFNR